MNYRKVVERLAMITQMGLTIIAPTVLCILLCWWLDFKYDIGAWIYIIGFVFGLGGSFMSAYKIYVSEVGKAKKESKKKVSFNRHL